MNKSLKNTHDQTNCLVHPAFRNMSGLEGGPSPNFPRTHASFYLTMASELASTSVIHLNTQREGEQACPYADGVFNRDTNTGGEHYCCCFYERLQYCTDPQWDLQMGRQQRNVPTIYAFHTCLPAFSNSFLRLNSCNFYYQPVYSR